MQRVNGRKLLALIGVAAAAVAAGTGLYGCPSVRDTVPQAERQSLVGSHSDDAKASAAAIETLKDLIDKDSPWAFHNFFAEQYLGTPDKPRRSTDELAAFLLDIWKMRKDLYPGLNWTNASKNQFRLMIASSLLSAARHSDLRYDTDGMRDYIRAMVRDDDELVAMFALLVLPLHGAKSDIPILKELATEPKSRFFEPAVRGLGMLCHPDAERLLVNLARTEKAQTRKRTIEHILDKYYRTKNSSMLCSGRRMLKVSAAEVKPERPLPTVSAKEAKLVEESIGKLKELINRDEANAFFQFVAYDIPVRFNREKVPTKLMAQFYLDFWENRSGHHPDLNWQTVGKDEFRFVIARELLSQSSAGPISYDTSGILSYLRSITSHGDEIVAGNALMALEVKGRDSEISSLKNLAAHAALADFKIAIRMLAGICLPEAKQALEELAKVAPSGERKQFVEQAVRDFYAPDGRFFNCRH